MSDKRSNKKGSPPAGGAKGSSSGTSGGTGPMNVDLLQQIVELMAANDLSTVDVRDGDKRIILKRGGEPVMMSMPAHTHAPQSSSSAPAPASGSSAAPTADAEANLKAIKSPMVGTFYSRPSPDAKPFVSVGSTVDEDTDCCVIEAMKVFNNIKAEVRGTVAKILVTDGQTVEFGQTLFLVK